jgi:GNAT superfamily N-acetyltransferase
MTANEIRFEHIKVGELPAFADRIIRKSAPGQFVPITRQRAIAHANNPYADDDDVGLLVAVDEEDEVVGYFGILPMLLRVDEALFKTHWFTTWSVSPKVRGRGVGTLLMKEALKLDLDYLIVGSIHARRVCEKFCFWEREPLRYYWIDMSGMVNLNPLTWLLRLFRKVVHLLNVKKEISISTPMIRWFDRMISPLTKTFFYWVLSRNLAGVFNEFSYQEVSQIRPDQPAQANRPKVELHRGIEAVNWMLSYPWIVEAGNSPTENMDYYFSDARPLYRNIAIEVTHPVDGAYQGYIVFSVSEKEDKIVVKTLDFRLSDASHYPYILALAVHYGKLNNADTIEIPDEVAIPLKMSLQGRLLLQTKTRIYQCRPKSENSPLAGAWYDIIRHLYDGDMAFS